MQTQFANTASQFNASASNAPFNYGAEQDRLLRLECLRIGGGSVEVARELYAWVTGEDAKTPGERIKDALAEAGVI